MFYWERKRAHYEKFRGMNARSHSNMIFFRGIWITVDIIIKFFSVRHKKRFISERENFHNLSNVPLATISKQTRCASHAIVWFRFNASGLSMTNEQWFFVCNFNDFFLMQSALEQVKKVAFNLCSNHVAHSATVICRY